MLLIKYNPHINFEPKFKMEEKVYQYTIISISLFLLVMTLLMNPSYYMSILVLSVALCIISLFIINHKNKRVLEGLQDQMLYNDDDAIYQEKIDAIKTLGLANKLTVYYTCFNNQSLRNSNSGRSSIAWFNISDYFVENICPKTVTADTHLTWSTNPSATQKQGVILSTNKGSGPKSYQLGLSEYGESFTVFFTLKFETFTQLQVNKVYELLNIYANNLSNNALAVTMTVLSSADSANNSNINFAFKLGENNKFELGSKPFTANSVYLFIITKTLDKFDVSVKPNLDSNSYQSNTANDHKLEANINNIDIHFSNKNLEINRKEEMMPIHFYNFGIFNGGIINELYKSQLATHIYNQFLYFDPIVQGSRVVVNNVVNELTALKQCKYNEDVCNLCDNITNWADINDVITNASPACLIAIDKYCKENPTESICSCWNPSTANYNSKSCKMYRAIFDPDGLGDTNNSNPKVCSLQDLLDDSSNLNISEEQMKEMKKKFKLCDCSVTNANSENNEIPLPHLVNRAYDLNKTDMELYDDIIIK